MILLSHVGAQDDKGGLECLDDSECPSIERSERWIKDRSLVQTANTGRFGMVRIIWPWDMVNRGSDAGMAGMYDMVLDVFA